MDYLNESVSLKDLELAHEAERHGDFESKFWKALQPHGNAQFKLRNGDDDYCPNENIMADRLTDNLFLCESLQFEKDGKDHLLIAFDKDLIHFYYVEIDSKEPGEVVLKMAADELDAESVYFYDIDVNELIHHPERFRDKKAHRVKGISAAKERGLLD